MSHSIKAIPAIVKYCESTNTSEEFHTPVIVQAFYPGRGWTTYPFRKRISRSWARKMLREGYTAVGLELSYVRVADFQFKELV